MIRKSRSANNNIIFTLVCLIAATLLIGSCEEKSTHRRKKFEERVAANRIGSFTPDHWLLIYNTQREWEKVALVFGFADNKKACEDYAQLYMQRYTSARSICLAAN
jgi:hypothetical protein